MAYDQGASYEPPRRHYYQAPPSNPALTAPQNEYADYASSPYDDYQQGGYGGGPQDYHQPHNGGYDGYGQGMNHAQEPVYHESPHGGYGQGYQQEPDRSYDPRYQPRAQRGPPPPQAQRGPPPPQVQRGPPPPQAQRGPPPQAQRGPPPPQAQRGPPPPQAQPVYHPDPRDQQRQNGYPQQQDGYPQQQNDYPQQQNGYPPQQNGHAQQRPRDQYEEPQHAPRAPPPQRMRSADSPSTPTNPDALPSHPVPVRPGLMGPQGGGPPPKPPPVRNYNGGPQSSQPPPTPTSTAPPSHQRGPSIDTPRPVTHAELDQLRASADSTNSPKTGLLLVKKLVEAASVLANEGGRADRATTIKNAERYTLDAHKRLKKLVAGQYPEAQFYLADAYGCGLLGLEPDTKEAFKLYQAAAKAGHPQAAYRTAVCCEIGAEEGGGTSRDYPKAVQWYRRAAALGDPAAMYKLGAILLKSLLGQQRNVAEAVTWLKRGAERADAEHPHALHELATLYESANTDPEVRAKVLPDDTHARDLYLRAGSLGYKFSQFRLGQAFEYGSLGLPIDNRQSISWYTKAAAQGEHKAELALSGWYLTGAEGVLEHSEQEAYLWARKAAVSEPPLPKAMFAMGYFKENGIGCERSAEEGRKWYGRAASHKFPKAIERLEELKRSGGKNAPPARPVNGKLSRKEGKRDQKRDEENCSVM
ncbi:uncharacterized protein MYCGRDRAFT_71704 [Zymoseptoria tritici IPO323]|uniref:HCP-like protein n=1 Tax=Zymoseptoria tritici (strain CBS 115943 / IPO323) TaxID=336722 RepID=F9XAK4_ZYMTI|nr:uncharacterized protein MYCGRDRAFT_71704 [Zymoseptoria tritici IPO323]EGP87010.1 hypothetical protein MYCGRDRAFT_71704 [Zymoseptoria tritici IPO323]